MAVNIIAMVDINELGISHPEAGMIAFFDDPNRIERNIRDLSQRWPNSTICIYRLSDMQKLKTPPTYARYKVNQTTGEITPA